MRPGSAGGFLFRARRGDATVFLYGILHIGAAEFYPLRPVILRPLRQSQALLVEVDVLAGDLPAQFSRYGLLRDGAAPARIAVAHRERVDQALRSSGIDPAAAARFKPDVLAAMLGIAAARQLGFTPDYSVDSFVIGFARGMGIPVVEMEGLQRQLTLNDDLPEEAHQAVVDDVVRALGSGSSTRLVAALVRAWRTNDLELLSRLYQDMHPAGGADRYRNQMARRNEAMVDVIAGRAAQHRQVFVAAGMLHMVGPSSLGSGLESRGFAVERVHWASEGVE